MKQYKQTRATGKGKQDCKSKLEGYSKKIEQFEELIDDQINWNARSTLMICGVKIKPSPFCTWYRMGPSPKLRESKLPDLLNVFVLENCT